MSEDARRDSRSTAMAEREKVIRDLIIQNPVPLDKLRALVSQAIENRFLTRPPDSKLPPLACPTRNLRRVTCGKPQTSERILH